MELQRKMRICVIGGGAAGLCTIRHFAGNLNEFEIEAFEKSTEVGGTWVYNEKTGLDSKGLPIHSSMYRDLRTNIACELMNFPDYRKMKADKYSSATHQQVLAYLKDYAEHFQLCQFIRFNTIVDHVQPEVIGTDKKTTWKVQIKDLEKNQISQKQFDAIIVCTGHFSEPNIPVISGIESFPGQILHSHSYRKPEVFSGKSVLIIGASASGIDIGTELCDHAHHVYLSHYGERIVSILPQKLTQVGEVNSIEGNTVLLKNNTKYSVDTIIYCTGYLITFPFLDSSCGITVDNNYVSPIYKHMININYPAMCFLGLNRKVTPFLLFHMQVQYFLALLKGRASLPQKEEMLEDSKCKTTKKSHAHILGEQEWSYYNNLAQAGGFDPLPPIYEIGYEAWTELRKINLWHYKDYKLIIADDEKSVEIILQK